MTRADRKVDKRELATLWYDTSQTISDIAARFGVASSAVWACAKRDGLPSRKDVRWYGLRPAETIKEGPKAKRVALPPAPKPDPLKDAVRATGGRYRALEAVAEQHGITLRRAQQEWHRVR